MIYAMLETKAGAFLEGFVVFGDQTDEAGFELDTEAQGRVYVAWAEVVDIDYLEIA